MTGIEAYLPMDARPFGTAADRLHAGERMEFLAPGFSLLAGLFPAPYLLFHRHLLLGLVVMAAGIGLAALVSLFAPAAWIINLALILFFGFETANLRRLDLARRGYRFIGVFQADTRRAAEEKAFQHLLDGELVLSPATQQSGAIIGWSQDFGARSW